MNKLAKYAMSAVAALTLSLGSIPPASAATHWYDCDTEGVAQCSGPQVGDAWESFDAKTPAPWYSHKNPLTYMRTYTNIYPMVGRQSIVIKSVNVPHTWHVFTYRTRPNR